MAFASKGFFGGLPQLLSTFVSQSPGLTLARPLCTKKSKGIPKLQIFEPSIHPVKRSETVKPHCQRFDWLGSSGGQKCCQAQSERMNLYTDVPHGLLLWLDLARYSLFQHKILTVATCSFLNLRKMFVSTTSIRFHRCSRSWSRSMDFVGSPGSICQITFLGQIFAKDSETCRLKRSAV